MLTNANYGKYEHPYFVTIKINGKFGWNGKDRVDQNKVRFSKHTLGCLVEALFKDKLRSYFKCLVLE